MTTFRFSLIIACSKLNHEEILDAAETLGEAGLTDASIRGHSQGMELVFEREADSLQSALTTAIGEVERTGFKVARVEMEREAIPV